ncbi:MAG: response regulator [Lachnospiraceae bacterium]|nr:response regulator [Lachnospiraceae bacterium]
MIKERMTNIKERYRKYSPKAVRAIQLTMFAILLVFTVCIWILAPKNAYFGNAEKELIWYGDGWSYVNQEGEPVPVYHHYLKLQKEGESVAITKVLDDEVLQDKYLCFRVKAEEVKLYVNDCVWYDKALAERVKPQATHVKRFYQLSTEGMHAGDKVTIEFIGQERGNLVVQYFSLGNRYSIESYVLSKCAPILTVCGICLLLVLLTILVYYSAVLLGNIEGYKALWWLVGFLMWALIYLLMDCGCMELWVRKSLLLYWLSAAAMLLMPIPLIMYIKRTFYPDSLFYDLLLLANQLLVIGTVLDYVVIHLDLLEANIYVLGILLLAVLRAIIGFVLDKKKPAKEVITGSIAIMVGIVVSMLAYVGGDLIVASYLFGTSLFFYSLCMLVFTVASRTKVRREKEAEYVRLLAGEKEAAVLANEQKTRFLSHMSHEIRTPLNAVLGMNELIMRETTEENVRKYSHNIQNAGKTLLGLINDVLDFSKIDTGKMEIVEIQYSLSSLINDVVCMVRERVQNKGLELRLDISSRMPDSLLGDEIRVKQIMINLLTNAAKYTEKGWVQIRMYHLMQDEETVNLNIEIADSGIGIKEEEMPRLFRDFERLDQLKNRTIEGTGLGLNITAGLIKMMGGEIQVESRYGMGSAFFVTLPQKVVNKEPIGDYNARMKQLESQPSDIKNDVMYFGGKRALVIDDNEMNLEVIASILEMMELNVWRASGGAEALEIMENELFDIIITDDMMPGMTGTELMIMVKGNHDMANSTVPMVVLTANAVSGVAEEYVKRGFQDYLTKPIDIEQLQAVLKKYLIK